MINTIFLAVAAACLVFIVVTKCISCAAKPDMELMSADIVEFTTPSGEIIVGEPDDHTICLVRHATFAVISIKYEVFVVPTSQLFIREF